MAAHEIPLYLTLTEAGVDEAQLDELTTRLLRDLHELGVESIKRAAGDAAIPQGAKPVDPVTWGALALVAVPALLPNLIQFLQAWSLRGESRKIKIKTPAGLEIEFTPDKKLSETEVVALANGLAQVGDAQTSTGATGLTQE